MPLGSHEIQHRFGFHPGTGTTVPKHEKIRQAYVAFAEFLDVTLSDCDAETVKQVFARLQDSSMWANYAIARLAPLESPERRVVTAKPKPPPAGAKG